MRRTIILISILSIAGIFMSIRPASCERSEIEIISAFKKVIPQFEMLQADIMANVSDGDQLDAEITLPDGTTKILPAFYDTPKSLWEVRYTPAQRGSYAYKLRLKKTAKTYDSKIMHFNVTPGTSDGFLRKNRLNHFYPVFDSGKPFFGIGHNIGWITNNNLAGYEKFFELMKGSGCNLTRVWLNTPWTFRIETEKLGIYNAEDGEKLDRLLDLAKKYNIYIILALDTYGALMEEPGAWSEQFWKQNPYNKVNGGPCEKPLDFFTNKDAKRLYKNRLRYIMGRWSHSQNIMAFELWNEVDAPVDWIKEMAGYIKSINPHGQFITTSLGYPWGNNFDESSVWSLNEIDIIDRHIYGNMTGDAIANIISLNKELSKMYNKCVLVGEFGVDSAKSDAEIDRSGSGAALHNSLWASTMSGSFATSLNWWWVEYVKAKNLYPHYKALSNFVRNVNWNSGPVEFLKTSTVKCSPKKGACAFSSVTIHSTDAWGEKAYREFSVANNGELSGGHFNAYLHGAAKNDLQVDPVFHVNYASEGKFVLHIDMVSQGAYLIVYLDGKVVLKKEFPTGPGAGPWKRSLHRKDYNIYQCIYDTDIAIDVPAGEHAIKLSNAGADWMRIKDITLTNYTSSDVANAAATGLLVDGQMLFWIYNKEYNWKNVKNGIEPSLIKGASFTVTNVENGTYNIEWWNTFEGKIISSGKIKTDNNELNISLPDFSKDVACKISRKATS